MLQHHSDPDPDPDPDPGADSLVRTPVTMGNRYLRLGKA